MQIDWFSLIAQIVNFLILVFLLRRFLYGPIIRVMDARQERIAAELRQAKEEREQAEREAEMYYQKRRELEERRDEMLVQIEEEGEARQKDLLQEAREEVERVEARWREAVEQEKESFLHDLRQRVGEQSIEIARRVVADLAGADLEQRMIETFMERIRNLDDHEKDTITESIRESGGEIIIRSALGVPEDVRRNLTDVVRANLLNGAQASLRFEKAPELISGIEMYAGGRRVAWTVKDYLDRVDERMAQILEEPAA